MAEDGDKPFLITPPPGLIPPELLKDRNAAPADLDSGTRRITGSPTASISARTPVFFATPIGPAPTGAAPAAADAVVETEHGSALVLQDGSRHPLEHTLLVGRNPAQAPGWESAGLLAVDDPAKSVSKTHAAFEVIDGTVRVHDLGSTNGVRVLRQGHDTAADAETVDAVPADAVLVDPTAPIALAAGDEILLGDYRVLLS